jgi:hypothetical protein
MVNYKESKLRKKCQMNGLDPEEVLQIMQVPYGWMGESYLFDFDSMPIETLSNYTDYIFKHDSYLLEEGSPINGIYYKSNYTMRFGVPSIVYKYKVDIYSEEEKTYLEISKVINSGYMKMDKKIYGENYLNAELNRLVDQIMFLKPYNEGYLICDNCGSYFELLKGESPKDYDLKCECGGTFKYIENVDLPDEKLVERKKIANKSKYMRAPNALVLLSLISIAYFIYFSENFQQGYLGIFGLSWGMVLLSIRSRGRELSLSSISNRAIYIITAALFLIESYGFFLFINYPGYFNLLTSIFAFISLLFGSGMIFKTIKPDSPRNFIDPPLWIE